MTDDEAKALGLRAVASVRQWADGMLARNNYGRKARVIVGISGDPPIECAGDWDGWTLAAGVWPDLRDPATMGAALALWQAQPGHVFRVPCPVLTNAAAYGLTDPRTIRALVGAMEASPPR